MSGDHGLPRSTTVTITVSCVVGLGIAMLVDPPIDFTTALVGSGVAICWMLIVAGVLRTGSRR